VHVEDEAALIVGDDIREPLAAAIDVVLERAVVDGFDLVVELSIGPTPDAVIVSAAGSAPCVWFVIDAVGCPVDR